MGLHLEKSASSTNSEGAMVEELLYMQKETREQDPSKVIQSKYSQTVKVSFEI